MVACVISVQLFDKAVSGEVRCNTSLHLSGLSLQLSLHSFRHNPSLSLLWLWSMWSKLRTETGTGNLYTGILFIFVSLLIWKFFTFFSHVCKIKPNYSSQSVRCQMFILRTGNWSLCVCLIEHINLKMTSLMNVDLKPAWLHIMAPDVSGLRQLAPNKMQTAGDPLSRSMVTTKQEGKMQLYSHLHGWAETQSTSKCVLSTLLKCCFYFSAKVAFKKNLRQLYK